MAASITDPSLKAACLSRCDAENCLKFQSKKPCWSLIWNLPWPVGSPFWNGWLVGDVPLPKRLTRVCGSSPQLTVIVHLLCFAADSGVNFSEATRISVALCHNVVANLPKQVLKKNNINVAIHGAISNNRTPGYLALLGVVRRDNVFSVFWCGVEKTPTCFW